MISSIAMALSLVSCSDNKDSKEKQRITPQNIDSRDVPVSKSSPVINSSTDSDDAGAGTGTGTDAGTDADSGDTPSQTTAVSDNADSRNGGVNKVTSSQSAMLQESDQSVSQLSSQDDANNSIAAPVKQVTQAKSNVASSNADTMPVLAGNSHEGAAQPPSVLYVDSDDANDANVKGVVLDTKSERNDSESGADSAITNTSNQMKAAAEERHSSFVAHFRNYYFYQDGSDSDVKESMALGGWLSWTSGYINNTLQLGATTFTSQKVYAPSHKSGAELLQEDQRGFSGVSELYADIKIAEARLRLGRFELTTPYMNRNDSRMVAQSFQGGALYFDVKGWNVGIGHSSKIKTRNSTDFEELYKVAGLPKNRNVSTFGATHEFSHNTLGGFYYYFAPDYMYIFYTELTHEFVIRNHQLNVSFQYAKQKSIGEKFAGTLDGSQFGLRATLERENYSSYLAYTSYSDNDPIQHPWGSSPSYTNMMISDFDRVGEDTILMGMKYDMDKINLPNVSLRWNLLYGNTPDSGSTASPDQWELDLTADYRFTGKLLQGLWLRARYAKLIQSDSVEGVDGQTANEMRFTLNYEYKW